MKSISVSSNPNVITRCGSVEFPSGAPEDYVHLNFHVQKWRKILQPNPGTGNSKDAKPIRPRLMAYRFQILGNGCVSSRIPVVRKYAFTSGAGSRIFEPILILGILFCLTSL